MRKSGTAIPGSDEERSALNRLDYLRQADLESIVVEREVRQGKKRRRLQSVGKWDKSKVSSPDYDGARRKRRSWKAFSDGYHRRFS